MGIGQTQAATDTSGNGGTSSTSSGIAPAAAEPPPLALLLGTTVTCDSAAAVQTDGAGDAKLAQQAGTADPTAAGGAATTPNNGIAGSTAGGSTAPYAPSGPPGPWDCIATTVSTSEGLATVPDLVAGAADSAFVFITKEAGSPVRVDNATWRTMSVKETIVVYILGRGRHASTLDLAGLAQGRFADVASDLTSQGLVAIY